MDNRKLLKALLIIVLLFSTLLPVDTVSAATSAKIISITGDVQVLRGGGEKPFKAFVNMHLTEGDRIITGIGATAEIELDNEDATITLSENTYIYLSELRGIGDSQQTSITLQSGSIGNSVKKALTNASRYEVRTPTAVMGVKGTHFLVSINPATGQTSVHVATGSVGGYIIPPQTPMVMPQIPITTPPPEEPGFTQPGPSPIAPIPVPIPFELNALEQIRFNENDSPEQLQQIQPEPLTLVGLDLTFIEQIEQLAQEQPGVMPPSVFENIEQARAAAIERSQRMEQNPNLAPDEFAETPGNIPRIITPTLPDIVRPPEPFQPPLLPPPPFTSDDRDDTGYRDDIDDNDDNDDIDDNDDSGDIDDNDDNGGSDGGSGPVLPRVSNVIITTDPAEVSNLPHDSEVTVTLSTATSNAKIYYTIDGSRPTSNSELYEDPLTVTASGMSEETVIVKAIGIKSGFVNSPVATKEIKFAAAEQPESSASVEIISLRPIPEDAYFYPGEEYSFDVEVEYEFANMSQAKIYLGFNNEEVDLFNLIAHEVVTSPSGTVTFNNIKTKVQYWEDAPFTIYVNIVEYLNEEDGILLHEDFSSLDVNRPMEIFPSKVDIIGLIENSWISFDDWAKAETRLMYQSDGVSFEGLYLLDEGEEIEVNYWLEENKDGTRRLTIMNTFFNDLFEGIQVPPESVSPFQLSFELKFSVRGTDTTISIPFIVDVNCFYLTTASMVPQQELPQDLPYDYGIQISYEDLDKYTLSILRYEESESRFYLHSSSANDEALHVSQPDPDNYPDMWLISTNEGFEDGVYYIVLHTDVFDQGEIIPTKDLIIIAKFHLRPAA